MPQQTSPLALSHTLKPLCPRENHEMSYERDSIQWNEGPDNDTHSLTSYHCGYFGCSVRYSLAEGYFTVIDAPDLPQFIEEPGANILQCPRHGTWMYRREDEDSQSGFIWACGVEGCTYEQRHSSVVGTGL